MEQIFHRVFNPTEKTVQWETEYEKNTYTIIIYPRKRGLVKKELVGNFLSVHPDVIDETVIENDPDYLDRQMKLYREREPIFIKRPLRISWWKRLFRFV